MIAALAERFHDVVDGLDEELGRVSGFIASPDFDGVDDVERQQRVRGALESALASAELLRIGPIIVLSHGESLFPFSDDVEPRTRRAVTTRRPRGSKARKPARARAKRRPRT